MAAKMVELIECEEREGAGKEGDPHRLVTRWYTKDGQLVAERDTWKMKNYTKAFGYWLPGTKYSVVTQEEYEIRVMGWPGGNRALAALLRRAAARIEKIEPIPSVEYEPDVT